MTSNQSWIYCNLQIAFQVAVLSLASTLLWSTAARAQSGIDSRPSNLSCVAPPRPESGDVTLEQAFDGFQTIRVLMTIEFPPDDPSHLFALDNAGRIHRFPNDPSTTEKTVPLSLRSLFGGVVDGMSGMMDMAFHPDFATNGELYIAYTVPGENRTSYVARYTSPDGGESFSSIGEIILALRQSDNQHNIGSLFFGDDGYLYAGFGDSLRRRFAQDTFDLRGKLLRIDVDSGSPYAIPPDNPFASGGGDPEIYAFGFRNPYRISQDTGGSGEIWAGDVGNSDWEEVSKVVNGGNYGWSTKEGTHCFEEPNCDSTGLIDPVYEYSHDNGCSVTGGHVYRGSLIPSLVGKYIFADHCTGEISSIEETDDGVVVESLITTGLSIIDFSVAPNGELFVNDLASSIMQLVPDTSGGGPITDLPQTLSETGCFDESDLTQVAEGVIPYDVNTELWSDGAEKRRWLAIPDGTQIDVLPDGDWDFPIGTVLIKEFAHNGTPFETRLMVRHDDGEWAGYTYEWNDSLTDADLVSSDGLTKDIDGVLTWTYPTRAQCMQCHSAAAGRSLGPETAQLNGPLLYPSGITANQLATLDHIGMFSNGLADAPEDLPALTDVQNASATLSDRSRSYLHANCANCHRPNGPGQGPMDFRYQTAFENTGTCDVNPGQGDLGVPGAKILTPGDSASSVMSLRLHDVSSNRMPPLGSRVVDSDGTATIDAWINRLKVCIDNQPPLIEAAFDIGTIDSGGTSMITFTLTNPNVGGLSEAAFSNTYPAGMTNSSPLVIGGTCLNVVTDAADGGSSFDVSSADIPSLASCTITANVSATATGTTTTSVLITNEAPDSIAGARATLTVNSLPPPITRRPKGSGGGNVSGLFLLILFGIVVCRRRFRDL